MCSQNSNCKNSLYAMTCYFCVQCESTIEESKSVLLPELMCYYMSCFFNFSIYVAD